ncbi:HAMP domain-containing sensor histidine kinase [Lentisphaera profundi]|uniref:histidine kinase n=1 Tax=Lentisphaera profundi TaxID=1658616 RepID=A0ABY7VQU4_9BACT|nr:HAMP domain-containing sensor histidine kinase [Lentisphaera profundi]WDE96573.1 HAMP domain-containing sensor histidine kinase [Lentisphaera profundi]
MSFKLLRNVTLGIYLLLGGLFFYAQIHAYMGNALDLEAERNLSKKEYNDLKAYASSWEKAKLGEAQVAPTVLHKDLKILDHLVMTLKEQEAFNSNSEEYLLISHAIESQKIFISQLMKEELDRQVHFYMKSGTAASLKIRRGAERIFWSFLIFFFGFGALLLVMIRSVRKPLDEMATAMREVRKENFAYSLPIDEERSDELTQLKRDFNIMIRKLEILHRRTEESREQLQHDAKQLKESVISKTRFIRHLGHELRSPLAAISSFSELMLEGLHGDITVKQEESLQRIMANAKNLLDLVNDLVDQAKAEAGVLELKLEACDMGDFCGDVLESVKIEAEKSGLEVAYIIGDKDLVCAIHQVRFRQVLVNLISNAIKFSKQGGKLELRLQQKGELVMIEVEDDGLGISPADQRNIFMEFHQGDTYKKDQGAGLGLHLSRQVARLHGGDITVISEKGKGSIFRVQLPLNKQKG